jgi:hypothetical protein
MMSSRNLLPCSIHGLLTAVRASSLVPRVVDRVEVFKTERPDGRHLGDVLTGLCPVKMRGIPGEHDDGAWGVRLRLSVVKLAPQPQVGHTGQDPVDAVLRMVVRHQLDAEGSLTLMTQVPRSEGSPTTIVGAPTVGTPGTASSRCPRAGPLSTWPGLAGGSLLNLPTR